MDLKRYTGKSFSSVHISDMHEIRMYSNTGYYNIVLYCIAFYCIYVSYCNGLYFSVIKCSEVRSGVPAFIRLFVCACLCVFVFSFDLLAVLTFVCEIFCSFFVRQLFLFVSVCVFYSFIYALRSSLFSTRGCLFTL